MHIKITSDKEKPINQNFKALICEKLNKAVGLSAFFSEASCGIKSRDWANSDIDRVFAAFLLVCDGLLYYRSHDNEFVFKFSEHYVWERIRDFDFNDIGIEISSENYS